jgi:hypothetical protein
MNYFMKVLVKVTSDLSKVPTGFEDYCIIVVWVHTVYPEKNLCTNQFTVRMWFIFNQEHNSVKNWVAEAQNNEEYPYMLAIWQQFY